jgi:hypothetical protein
LPESGKEEWVLILTHVLNAGEGGGHVDLQCLSMPLLRLVTHPDGSLSLMLPKGGSRTVITEFLLTKNVSNLEGQEVESLDRDVHA